MINLKQLTEATTSASIGGFAIPLGPMLRPVNIYSTKAYKKAKKKKKK